MSNRSFAALLGLAAAALVSACASHTPSETAYTNAKDDNPDAPKDEGLLAGLNPFGSSPAPEAAVPNAIGVNTYLWRASLDTVSFMPVASADPFGGVIITDWYSPPESPTERFKVNVFILDRQLRSDGIRAAVFRQTETADGHWADAPVDPKTALNVENAILAKARELRIGAVKPQ
jgi:hypothetical protein